MTEQEVRDYWNHYDWNPNDDGIPCVHGKIIAMLASEVTADDDWHNAGNEE